MAAQVAPGRRISNGAGIFPWPYRPTGWRWWYARRRFPAGGDEAAGQAAQVVLPGWASITVASGARSFVAAGISHHQLSSCSVLKMSLVP